jgi:[ribosomal protein S5]-alanine N-acetyltransferase
MKSKVDFPRTSERLSIRDFESSDREYLLSLPNDPSQLQYMLFDMGTVQCVDDFLAFTQALKKNEKRDAWHLALEEKGKHGCIGGVALMIEKEASCSAELGYWLIRPAWGKGYATEASQKMLHFGFVVLGLHRIWGKCHEKNTASAHVMEKLGMQFEGRIREHVWLRDHYRTSLLFSMLEHEYKEPGGQ